VAATPVGECPRVMETAMRRIEDEGRPYCQSESVLVDGNGDGGKQLRQDYEGVFWLYVRRGLRRNFKWQRVGN
jgi:hypothetical protein